MSILYACPRCRRDFKSVAARDLHEKTHAEKDRAILSGVADEPALQAALKRFVNSGLTDSDKPLLRKHKLIEYSHAFWHLSALGKSEATRLGFL